MKTITLALLFVLSIAARADEDRPACGSVGPVGAAPELAREFTQLRQAVLGQAIGSADNGRLANGVELPEPEAQDGYLRPGQGIDGYFGVAEMIALIRTSLDEYHRQSNTVLNVVGISSRLGGRQHDHSSHQNGLDADVRYPMGAAASFTPTTARETYHVFSLFVRNARALGVPITTFYVAPTIRHAMCALLKSEAGLPEDERAADTEVAALLRVHPHHGGHFHVRISCPDRLRGVCEDAPGAGRPGCES